MKKILLLFSILIFITGCSLRDTTALKHNSAEAQVIKSEQGVMNNEQNQEVTKEKQQSNNTNIQYPNIQYQDTSTSSMQPDLEPKTFQQIPETHLKLNNSVYPLTSGKTLYNAMQELDDLIFSTKDYPGMGKFVEEINGIKNNPRENMYWFYYLNGTSASIGISQYVIQEGDIIEWKYEESTL